MYTRLIILTLFLANTGLFAQNSQKVKAPIKYRLLLTTLNIVDVSNDEISVSLNAFNTGRNPIDFNEFNSVPKEMELKFEESFHRSSISDLKNDIIQRLLAKNIVIPNGKILRGITLNLASNDELYKLLTKKDKRFTKNYQPRSNDNKSPKLKYKTKTKKDSKFALGSKKNKNDKISKVEVAEVEKKIETVEVQKPMKEKNIDIKEKEVLVVKAKKEMPAIEKEKEMPIVKVEKEMSQTKIEKETVAVVEIPKEKKNKNVGVVIADKKEGTVKKEKGISIRKKEKKEEEAKIRKENFQIEKESEKIEQQEILESLGVSNKKKETKNKKKEESTVAFDTKESVEASKNSYAEKARCPDLIMDNLTITKKTKKWVTVEYTLTNVGKGPAYFGGGSGSQGIALRAFLSSSDKISRGALPLGGSYVKYDGENNELYPENSFTTTVKLDVRKMTRFTPFIILNIDPFNSINECDKTNNYSQIKVD